MWGGRVAVVAVVVFVVLACGCTLHGIGLDGRACPCTDGYECDVDGICIAEGDGDAPGGDGDTDGTGDGDGPTGDGDGEGDGDGDGDGSAGDGSAGDGDDVGGSGGVAGDGDGLTNTCDGCMQDRCGSETARMEADTDALSVIACAEAASCVFHCCTCNAICDDLGINYGQGPCVREIETAAGVVVGAGAAINGNPLRVLCEPAPRPDNPCAIATAYFQCREDSCFAECSPPIPTPSPPVALRAARPRRLL